MGHYFCYEMAQCEHKEHRIGEGTAAENVALNDAHNTRGVPSHGSASRGWTVLPH